MTTVRKPAVPLIEAALLLTGCAPSPDLTDPEVSACNTTSLWQAEGDGSLERADAYARKIRRDLTGVFDDSAIEASTKRFISAIERGEQGSFHELAREIRDACEDARWEPPEG